MKQYFLGMTLALIVLTLVVVPVFSTENDATVNRIVLIGGKKSHNSGEHDFHHGIRLFQEFLENAPEVKRQHLVIEAHPYDWPSAKALEGAATVVLYFDGVDRHPLLDDEDRTHFARLMEQGIGVIALHQATTVPAGNTSMDMQGWLGGVRYGYADRTTTSAHFSPNSEHPISRGVEEFTYHDEFYPTLQFSDNVGRLTPILVGNLHVDFSNNQAVYTDRRPRTIAWALERKNGGRSFGFTGGHFLTTWDVPQLRKLLLNAIFWTAGLEVPASGVETETVERAAMQMAFPSQVRGRITRAIVSRAADNKVIQFPWGRLDWYVSGELNNSDTMTTGLATILPGKANTRHFHPSCDEVLHVIKGHIRHTMDEQVVEMSAGDTVSIPAGVHHNAINIGTEDAVLAISFSSAWREVVGE